MNTGNKEIRETAEDFILKEKPESIIDVGCNTGILSYRLRKKGYIGKYVGIDSNIKSIVCARNLNSDSNSNFSYFDVEEEPWFIFEKAFDIVYSKDVIEHLEYYDKALYMMQYMAKKTFILSMFIRPGGAPDKIELHKDGYYLNRYNREKLIGYVNSFGFKEESIYQDEIRFGYELLVFRRVS